MTDRSAATVIETSCLVCQRPVRIRVYRDRPPETEPHKHGARWPLVGWMATGGR